MEKSFDLKNLTERLKAKGLDIAEDAAMLLINETFAWTEESLAMHPNPYVKFALPVVQTIKPLIVAEADKIDGKIG